MTARNPSSFLGDALTTLNVRRTPAGRRGVMYRTQVPFALLLSLTLTAVLLAGIPYDAIDDVVWPWAAVVAIAIAGFLVPWENNAEVTGLIMSSFDLVAIGFISAALMPAYPTIDVLVLFPVVIMSFAFGTAGLIAAILGTAFVSAFPIIDRGIPLHDPTDWISTLVVFIIVAVTSVVVHYFSVLLQRSQRQLREATRVSDEAALESENQRAVMSTVLDTMDVGTSYVRADNTVAFTNKAARTILAKSNVDATSRAGTSVYESDRVTPIPPEEQMMAQAARGEYFDSRLYWIGDGPEQRSILVTARPVIGHDDQHIGSVFVSKDVTELTDAIRAREDFLAGVSHELRTPLTSIIGYLELIEDSIDVAEVGIERELGIIQRNSNQLLMRIGDLLHVTDDDMSLRKRPVEITNVVRQAIDAIRFRADNSGLSITTDFDGPFEASVDHGRFTQVLDNLLTNAVKYTPRGGTIHVTAAMHSATMTITVEDTGTGIPAADLRHVFERFYRAESVRGSAIAGAGLGLAIVSMIVSAHHGTATVDSTVGIGTRSTITMPRGFDGEATAADLVSTGSVSASPRRAEPTH
ncbi:ATP-binding protein [Glaciihabitans sp. dw_435]|uniref:ATP-binding protein n=1 Tax=Glaciihabitans sp. dw_435 TaxID=2720081 RepID=UPI001BD656D2|nr:ATP-binding protein [Glaciihabitans sp. dw_435]